MKGQPSACCEIEASTASPTETIRNLKKDLKERDNIIEEQGRTIEKLNKTLEKRDKTIREQDNRLRYYENKNSPPSADSLEWKRQKAQRRKERARSDAAAGDDGTGEDRKKPGGQKGHNGVSRTHRPTRVQKHCFPGGRAPECKCGTTTEIMKKPQVRDMIGFKIKYTETRHETQRAVCPKCGTMHTAPDGLPRRGSYDTSVVTAVTKLRSEGVPHNRIPGIMSDILGVHMSKSTAINSIGRVCDAAKAPAEAIAEEVRSSKTVCIDETGINLAGRLGWAWAMLSAVGVFMIYADTRSARILDQYMGGYGGAVTSDGYPAYKRFGLLGRLQRCWAHELRFLLYGSQKKGALLFAGVLYRQMQQLFKDARECLEGWDKLSGEDLRELEERTGISSAGGLMGRHSPELRRRFETNMQNMLFGYVDAWGGPLEPLLKRMHRALPCMFAFLEYEGVEPTNNGAERALRPVVLQFKISGQIKGGLVWTERHGWLNTCVSTWKLQGKSIMDEVAKII